jgi:hypothetical protein
MVASRKRPSQSSNRMQQRMRKLGQSKLQLAVRAAHQVRDRSSFQEERRLELAQDPRAISHSGRVRRLQLRNDRRRHQLIVQPAEGVTSLTPELRGVSWSASSGPEQMALIAPLVVGAMWHTAGPLVAFVSVKETLSSRR